MSTSKKYIEETVLTEGLSDLIWIPVLLASFLIILGKSMFIKGMLDMSKKLDIKKTELMKKLVNDEKVEVYRVEILNRTPNALSSRFSQKLYYTKTLEDILNPKEILALLCHAYGHYKGHHLLKQDVISYTIPAAVAAFMIFLTNKGLTKWVTVLMYFLFSHNISQRISWSYQEYIADSYANKCGMGKELLSALHKIEIAQRNYFCKNLGKIDCDKAIEEAAKYQDHPTFENRIKKLTKTKEMMSLATNTDNPRMISRLYSSIKEKLGFGNE